MTESTNPDNHYIQHNHVRHVRPHCCAGCLKDLNPVTPQFRCRFGLTGFPFDDGTRATPCNTRYHLGCIQVGVPFKTRLAKNKGMYMPPLKDHPSFICEA